MKTLKVALLMALTLLQSSRAEEVRFFRISGPVVSTITAFSADGYVTWTNAPTNATFTVQTAPSLFSPINWVDYIQVPVTNPVTTHRLYDPSPPSGTALIPAGSFTMGTTFDDGGSGELPLHVVYVSAFYMDKYEVTKTLWDSVYQWAITHGYSIGYVGSGKATNHPVQTIEWYDSVKWCNARAEKEGLTPCYYSDSGLTAVYKTHGLALYVKWNANGYRLPTEAEWEKAARGGASGRRFPWSDADTISWNRANYYAYPLDAGGGYTYDVNPTLGYHPTFNDGVRPYTSPVGYFAPNGYKLYDMAGNVWEWCWDWYDGNWYSNAGATQNDTRGPGGPSNFRVMRGGSWNFDARLSRCASRSGAVLGYAVDIVGFRCVRGL